MDSARDIARDMLEAINVDGSGFIGAVAKGLISFPVSLGYLGYDFIDTKHRRENQDDKFRLAELVKRTTFNRGVIEKIIKVFMDDFSSRINIPLIAKNVGGSVVGKTFFSQLTGVNLGAVISTRAVTALFSGVIIGLFLSIGSESSRAIYTARFLQRRNPIIYFRLKKMGDLDLFYFLVEDTVKPFEKACEIDKVDPGKFNKICEHFFGGL